MTKRKKILILAPEWRWPPTTGGEVRIARLTESLAQQMDVDIVGPAQLNTLPPPVFANSCLQELSALTAARRVGSLLRHRNPYHVNLYYNSRTSHQIAELVAQNSYDAIYSHFIYPLAYLSHIQQLIIIDQHNVDRQYWLNKANQTRFPFKVIAAWNQRRTVQFESRYLSTIFGYVSCSEEDRAATMKYAAPLVPNFWVAPNGVDSSEYVPAAQVATGGKSIVLGYLGSMDLEMNICAVEMFIKTMLPRIRAALPGIEIFFDVIGRDPPPSLIKLASQSCGVSVTGRVPKVAPFLQRLDILVCPIRMGAGTKLKVIEAMSCGIPVVGSNLALAGLPGRSGEQYIRADQDDVFIRAVCQLAISPEMRLRIGAAARELVCSRFDWKQIGSRLAHEICIAIDARRASLK